MRTIRLLATAVTLFVLSQAAFAESLEECQARCTSDRESRNMDCPSPQDNAAPERAQCLKDSQIAYDDCIKGCPPPPPVPAGAQTPGPMEMGY